MRLFPILFLSVLFISCHVNNEVKNGTNALKKLLPKEDSLRSFDHFILIDSTETYYIDKVQISSENIASKIKELKEAKNNLKIQVEIDKNVIMEKVVVVMDACKKENVKLSLKSK